MFSFATSPHNVNISDEAILENSTELQVTPSMCYYCFEVLIDSLQKSGKHGSKRSIPAFAQQLADASVECPLFVTWENRKREHYHLRGCIGTLSPRLLATSVGEYALISALKDRRFNPIVLAEVPELRVAVSLLVKYEVCANVFDWTVGVHGILIKLHVQGHEYSATCKSKCYHVRKRALSQTDASTHFFFFFQHADLPEVAQEQRWDHRQAVESLVQKAGYHGPLSKELLASIHCTRYQSSKCRITFEEYVAQDCQGQDPVMLPPTRRWDRSACNTL